METLRYYRSEHLVGQQTNTVVIAHYPRGGNEHNTGHRYQIIADITGFDVVGILPRTSNRSLPRSRLHQDRVAERFAEKCAERAQNLVHITDDFKSVVMYGESVGSLNALGMTASGILRVTHCCIINGISLNRPAYRTHAALEFANEQYHLGSLWRSPFSRDMAIDLASEHPQLPLYTAFLGHTATATSPQIERFKTVLEALRNNSIDSHATVRVVEDAERYYYDLRDPQYVADHLMMARRMISLVA